MVWLAFDDVARQPDPAASVCVCLAPSCANPFASVPPPRQGGEVLETMVMSARAVRDRRITPHEAQLLERCIDRLPDGARWIYLSMMTARTSGELKLHGLLPRASLVRYLRDVEWPGTLTTLAQFLARYHALEPVDAIHVELPLASFDDAANPGLGLCFSQQAVREAQGRSPVDPARTALLNAVARDGLCSAVELAALKRWAAADLTAPVDRWLDIKLVYGDARPVLAKAYLGFARRGTAGDGLSLSRPEPPRPE
jgi:hypothetical protein